MTPGFTPSQLSLTYLVLGVLALVLLATAWMVERFSYEIAGAVAIVLAVGLVFAGLLRRTHGQLAALAAQRTAQLTESEERYARAMEASNDGLWEWNPDTDEMFVSPRARRIFGIPEEAQISTRADVHRYGSIHPQDRAHIEKTIQAYLKERSGALELQYRVIQRSGEMRWVLSRGKVFPGANGGPVVLTGSLTDVTERKRAEIALRASEERYARVMHASEDGFWEWIAASDEFYASPRMLELYGMPPDTVFHGRKDFLSRCAFHPEDLPLWRKAVAAHLAGGSPRVDLEVRAKLRHGMGWIHLTAICLRDASGAEERWTGSVSDVTERRRAQDALLRSEERYSLAMEASAEGHFDLNLETGEIFISERLNEIYGFPPGTRFANREEYLARVQLHPHDIDKYHAALNAALAKGGPERYEFEFRVLGSSGEVRWLRTRGKVVRDMDGRARRRTGVVADITAAKIAEEALRESQERYALAVAGSDEGIWDVDFAKRRVFVSARARELAGMPPGPDLVALEEWFASLPLHPEDTARRTAALQAHLAGETPAYVGEFRLRQPDGVYRWRRLRGLCVRHSAGKPHRMAGSISDIDARKRAEESLRVSEERYALAMEAAGDGHTDWNLVTGEFYISPRLFNILGYPPGTTFADRADWVRRFPFHPEDRPRWEAAIAAHFASRDAKFRMDLRIVVNGETRWVAFTFIATRDAAGKPVRWTGSIADIDESKRAAEALRQSEDRHSRAMTAADAGFWDWHLAKDEFYVSPRLLEMTGFPPGTTFAGRADFMRRAPFHPDDLEAYQRAVKALFAGTGSRIAMELRVIVDGKTTWQRLAGMCFRDADGKVVRWTGSATYVTARKLAEDALRLSEERYELAMRASGAGHWDWRIESDEFYASPRYLEFAGFPPDMKYSRRADVIPKIPFHPEDRAKYEAAVAAHFAGETPRVDMVIRVLPHGKTRWLHVIGMCLRDSDGKPVRWAGSVTDMTARKVAEDALRLSEERYALAMEVAEEGHFDWNVRTDEIFSSTQALRVMGVPEDIKYRTRADIVARVRYHPDDWPRISAQWRAALDGRATEHEFEYRILRGEQPHWIRGRWKVFRDEAGTPLRVVGVIADITERKLAVDKLRESEARFRALAESALAGIYLIQENRFRYVNPAMARMFGYTPEELVDRLGPADLVYADDRALVAENIRRRVEREVEEIRYEFRGVRKDGSLFPVEVHGRRIEFGGKPGVMGALVDNTERKRAVDELRASEARFRALTELSSDAYWAQDENLRFVPSGSSHDLAGFPAEAHMGKTRWELSSATPLSGSWADHQAVLEARKPFRDFEYRRVAPDGTIRYLSISGAPIFDEQGKFRGYQGVGRDITDRKRAEEELRESEALKSAMFETALDCIISMDHEGRVVEFNPAAERAFGYRRADVVGKELAELIIPPRLREQHRSGLARYLATGEGPVLGTRLEMTAMRADGAEFPVELSVTRIPTEGAPLFTAYLRDITERKRAVEDLRESESRFRTLVELNSGGFWQQDEDLRYTPSNFPHDITGYSTDDRIGKTRWELPGDLTPLSSSWEEHKAVHAARQPFRDFEYRRVRPDGKVGYYSATGVPIFDDKGTFKGYWGVATDITERKLVEEELRESEERYAVAMEVAEEGHLDWNARTDEFFASAQARRVLNLPEGVDYRTRHDVMGRVVYHPDDGPRVSAAWRASLASREAEHELEYRILRGAEARWIRGRWKIFRDGNGTPQRVIGVVSDITERRQAVDTLRESESRFRALTELSSDWFWQQDENLRFVSYLPAEVGTRSGVAAAESLGKARWEFDNTTPLSSSWAEHRAILEARQPFRDFEYVRLDKDGLPHYTVISGVPTFDAHGKFTGYQGVGRNVSERRRIEAELRSRQEMLELAQKSAQAVAFEWSIGGDGLHRNRWSPELAAMYGLAPEDRDGSFERWKKLVHRDDWPAVKAAIKHALRTGDVDTEYRVVHRDGAVRWLQAKGRMFFDAENKPVRMLGFLHDVTERKRVEEALRQSEERYALAVAGSNEGIFDWDLVSDRVYVSYRAQELFGLPRGELWRPRRDWRHILSFHPDDSIRLHHAIKAHIEGSSATYDEEFRLLMPDGGVRWFRQRGIALRDASGKAYRVVGSIGDVTEKHSVEEELRAVERKLRLAQRLEAMGTLAGGIAHDFNNILGAILGYGEMALRDAPKGSRLHRDLDSMITAGERGRALVDRVLAFSRSGVGERVPVHVEKVVREALDLISAKLPPDVTLHAKLHAGRAAMLGDATQVHQVVMNLATNAIQAMPGGGTLRVSLRTLTLEAARAPTIGILDPGAYLVLEVNDTGSGIAPDILDRIFDPFFTTKEVGTGTGLGLSLVHGIVAEVGGAIDVTSKVGAGTTFTVYLPRCGDAGESAEDAEDELPRGDGQRVLVVDDEEPLVRLATRTLEELGYMPVGFTSSTKALAAFRADPQRFDAVITDERMPGMSGSALIREVRGIRRIPIVLMSGFVGGAIASRAREAGAEEVLKKPLSARDLATSLARVLHP